MSSKQWALLMSMFVWAPSSLAGMVSGEKLLSYCENQDGVGKALCLGYIDGVVDFDASLLEKLNVEGQKESGLFCLPSGVTNHEIRLALLRFLRANPASLYLSADKLVMLALIPSFPCDTPE